MDTFTLQCPGPPDIVLLIKPGLEFDQGSDGFAILAGLHERVDNRGVGADTIEGDLDGKYIGVMGSLPDKVHDRGETVVRLVEQDIVVTDRGKDIPVIGEICRNGGGKRRVLEVGAVKGHQLHEIGHPHRVADTVEHRFRHTQFGLEHVAYAVMHRTVDLNTHRLSAGPLLHDLLDRGEEVRGLVDLDLEIRIPGDPEGKRSDRLKPGEEHTEVGRDDLLEIHEMNDTVIVACAAVRIWDTDKPREEVGRDLDTCKKFLPVMVPDDDGEVEGEVGYEGERVGTVERKRGEDREDLVNKKAVHCLFLRGGHILVLMQNDPGCKEAREQLLVPAVVLCLQLGKEHLPDRVELPGRGHAIGRSFQHAFG